MIDNLAIMIIWGCRISSIFFTLGVIDELRHHRPVKMPPTYWVVYFILIASWFVCLKCKV
jgi:hypothetical protein